MHELQVQGMSRAYGAFKALDDVSFTVEKGSFVTLLGPSGCGKSTSLWLIAGLDTPTAGTIRFGSETLADCGRNSFVSAENRNFGLVFQSYALWPHMTMRENLAFPLKLRGLSRKEMNERIDEISGLVELTGQLDKYPYQLSGGQQQRVALARTLIYRPRLLLLDEPLSNLDTKLRDRARVWLRALQRKLGITTIYVTHDQTEALAMSDRIIVMESGRIAQDAAPEAVYRSPATPFVADFIGGSSFLRGTLRTSSEGAAVTLDDGASIHVPEQPYSEGTPVTMAVRPESIAVRENDSLPPPEQATILEATFLTCSYLGSKFEIELSIGKQKLRAYADKRVAGPIVRISIPRRSCIVFAYN